jgi:hypothetical protein
MPFDGAGARAFFPAPAPATAGTSSDSAKVLAVRASTGSTAGRVDCGAMGAASLAAEADA